MSWKLRNPNETETTGLAWSNLTRNGLTRTMLESVLVELEDVHWPDEAAVKAAMKRCGLKSGGPVAWSLASLLTKDMS